MSQLETAIRIATSAHYGQKDKGGAEYILHPLRLMLQFNDSTTQAIAVLHDVVEDSNVTLKSLEGMGICKEVVDAVDALTRRAGESRMDAARRTVMNPAATRVKMADIRDNLNVGRLNRPLTAKDHKRINEYREVLEFLIRTAQMRVTT